MSRLVYVETASMSTFWKEEKTIETSFGKKVLLLLMRLQKKNVTERWKAEKKKRDLNIELKKWDASKKKFFCFST